MKNKKTEKETEEDLVKSVLKDFEIRQLERKSFESTWQLNINFFLGNQYCFISPAGDIVDSGKQYFWQEKEVYNHIANIIELRQSKLSRVRPSLTVVPFSPLILSAALSTVIPFVLSPLISIISSPA